ncbi:MAG: hypothetical protein GC204_08205 [Chloroflexi bacterium]|nr:hypothetical protein [Chloroflexota bacterium]
MPEILIFAAIISGIGGWIAYQLALMRVAGAVYQRLKTEGALLVLGSYAADCSIQTVGGTDQGWRHAVVALTADGLEIYPRKRGMDETHSFAHSALHWFGRPQKYHNGRNEIWLHYQTEDQWHLIKLKMSRGAMAEWVRMFKEFATLELITAYRRHRPYVHYGPMRVQPAEEDIYGAWTLQDPVALYVMPMQMVILRETQVLRTIALTQVTQVAAMRRIDKPKADGLVRFSAGEEQLAFACKEHQALGQAVAEAAKSSLEQPLLQKQKGKKDDNDEDGE